MTDDSQQQMDYLIGAPFDEVVMVSAFAVRQTINAVYVDATADLHTDNAYEVAYVCPVGGQKKIKAIVAIPVEHKMSVIPYPSLYDWQVELRRYDNIVLYEDGSSAPFMGDELVL